MRVTVDKHSSGEEGGEGGTEGGAGGNGGSGGAGGAGNDGAAEAVTIVEYTATIPAMQSREINTQHVAFAQTGGGGVGMSRRSASAYRWRRVLHCAATGRGGAKSK